MYVVRARLCMGVEEDTAMTSETQELTTRLGWGSRGWLGEMIKQACVSLYCLRPLSGLRRVRIPRGKWPFSNEGDRRHSIKW